MALINCAKVTSGSGGNQYDVTTNVYPNCPAGYVVTTSTYVLGLETQIAQLQQDIATAQSTTLISQQQFNQCSAVMASASCTSSSSTTYTTADLLLGSTVLSPSNITLAIVMAWAFGRLNHFIRSLY
jgi:hypothetical protein